MRSRYSAFIVGDLDHLQRTSAGEAALKFNRTELALSLPNTEWLGLEISDTEAGQEGDVRGSVTFTARFRENGRLHAQGERSEFRRVGGAWHYVSGEVDARPEPGTMTRVGRNDPCPCGSGKKYKKCHGA
ncbi:MAG: motif domain protein [Rhizobium sp.]|nr:motif domain protein [Rhizobium sp.]